MKKLLAILAAGALILAAGGCNGDEEPSKTDETTKGSGGKVTQIVFGDGSDAEPEEDTTSEALAFLKEKIPLYVRYLETRRAIPLSYETAIVSEGTRATAGVYIRDEKTLALTAYDEDGDGVRVVYKDGRAYEIDDAARTIRYMSYPEENAAELVESYRIKLKLSEVEKCSYVDDYEELNGVVYQHEIIYDEHANASNFYYDEETGEIRYIRVGEEVSEVLTLTNEVTESAFDLPTDYTMIDYDAELASEYASRSAEISRQNAEVLEAAKTAETTAAP
ncbi:MAG: hypothetical protein NC084_09445 [Bacteroides sp.]|nr:hypothetical protein [Eubacterium sp.]MCM1417493.1 hypothetical protein [Roseburia sp.]MCM1462921.1 hypothetical protein [Bacteroides sp.]